MKHAAMLLIRAAVLVACALVTQHVEAWGQSHQPVIVPVEFPDEFHVYYFNGECTQTLIVPSSPHRAELERFNISYRRSDGCLWWPLDREIAGLSEMLPKLFASIGDGDRSRLIGFYFGRLMQPEFRLRIANVALQQELTQQRDDSGLYRRLREALNAADAFRELRELFAAQGFELRLGALEKLERVREVEIAQWSVDPKQLDRVPPPAARIPIAAILWFDLRAIGRP